MASMKLIHSHFLKLSLSKPTASVCPCVVSVRWKKPRWLPRAPSKEFYVPPEKPYIDPADEAKLRRSYELYRNEVAAIRQHLAQQLEEKESQDKETAVKGEDDWDSMVQMIDKWNKKVAIIRERRQVEDELKLIQRQTEEQQKNQNRVLRMMAEAEEKVTFEKKQKFITMDNLDEEIEKVLDLKTDYEYAIDEQGYRYTRKGREPLPAKAKNSQLTHS